MAGASICILYPADSPFFSPSAAPALSSLRRTGNEREGEKEGESERERTGGKCHGAFSGRVLAAARSVALSFSRYSLAPRGRDV
jgi:hypothetical protein